MWTDNETDRDFLNFTGVAETVAEIIRQAKGRPISIGVSGQWGVGKSSMMRLIQAALRRDEPVETHRRFVFVEFNAWLYQGYDDARAALMDVIASRLAEEAKGNETVTEKIKGLLKRVKWLRLGKMVASSGASAALAIAMGMPPMGWIGGALKVGKKVLGHGDNNDTNDEDEEKDGEKEEEGAFDGLLEDVPSPPKQIQALRDSVEELLDKLGITLVVLIDDLDRCLPETTISTLEAIRLFLFLRNTAFVIAADDEMIKHAVAKHFDGIENKQVINYFDKLIQVPVRVPPLGTQEVRAYLYLLFIETSTLSDAVKNALHGAIATRLKATWQGKHVDRPFLNESHPDYPPELITRFDTADRLAPIFTHTLGVQGNPRLIKRFLNALSIRMSLARAQGVTVDEAVLAKLMLFERFGKAEAFKQLINSVTASSDGKPAFLEPWENAAKSGNAGFAISEVIFDDAFVREWLRIEPSFADRDLRGAVFVSRDNLPIITSEAALSAEAAGLLAALVQNPSTANSFAPQLAALGKSELAVIMAKLLVDAKAEDEWGAPEVLVACMAVARAGPDEAKRLAAFLRALPPTQIKPSIVPKISGEEWSKDLFDHWLTSNVSQPVKKAIGTASGRKG